MDFILNVEKWRCGGFTGDAYTTLGKGETKLKNNEGYMCCLGQFISQIDPNLNLTEMYEPCDLDILIEGLTQYFEPGDSSVINTTFSAHAIEINDNPATSVRSKIKQLRKLCKEHGHTLKVKNLKLIKF